MRTRNGPFTNDPERFTMSKRVKFTATFADGTALRGMSVGVVQNLTAEQCPCVPCRRKTGRADT